MQGVDELAAISIAGAVATITLDSQHNRNALSSQLITQLTATLTECSRRTDLRVVVLTHRGPAFCSGADLKESIAGPPRAIADLPALLAVTWELPIPLVAVVSGAVRGGGFGLLCSADIVLASPESSFGFSEVRVGAVAAIIWPLVSRRLAPSAHHLLLTGETFDARYAARIGLVTDEVPADRLDAEVARTVTSLLQGAPNAIASVKAMTRSPTPQLAVDGTLRQQLRPFAAASATAFASKEGREGVAAFVAKRVPNWVVQPPQTEQGKPL